MKTKILFLAVTIFVGALYVQAQTTLSHHTDPATVDTSGLACWFASTNEYKDNRFARTYDLNAFGITEDFEISAVEFGQGFGDDGKTVIVNVYISDSENLTTFPVLTLVSTTEISLISSSDFSLITVSTQPAIIPAGSIVMVEIFSPAHATLKFFPGFNLNGHSGTAWVKVPDCGITQWTDANAGQSDQQHLLINIVGAEVLGIDNNLIKVASVHPNPTTEKFTVELNNVYEKIDITITNILGQKISSLTKNNTDKLNLSLHGESGVYFVTINTPNGKTETIKLIKK